MDKVRYSYLKQQFEHCDDLWDDLKAFVATGDFTLGKPLSEFERRFAELIGVKYAIGVNSGTDAIKLGLKAQGIGPGDQVITAANTFVATVGAICEIGAEPVFVDCDDSFCMDVDLIDEAVTDRTRAIVPVHFSGYMTDMRRVMSIAERLGLIVVEDACQSILGAIDGKKAGSWAATGAFSLHPLKNINVWSDGGVITTNDEALDAKIRLLRNHGLVDRDTVEIMGYNSRLDTFQAVVGNWLIPQAHDIAAQRIANAKFYDDAFRDLPGLSLPVRPADMTVVYHLYMVFAEDRDGLLHHCKANGVEAKVHYPVPIYRQPALAWLGHKPGDFPTADRHAAHCITFPCDQHLSQKDLQRVVDVVRSFRGGGASA